MRKRRMEQELNHPHFVGVRLSDIELELLDRKAEILGVSRSECLRKLLVEKEIVHRVEVVADMEELRSLVGAYGKIGVNLNQIARYFIRAGNVRWQWRMKSVTALRNCFHSGKKC